MAYIGVQPADAYTSFAVQHFTTSATTSYTLDFPVANENEIALFINNVRQEPGSGYAYTASGTSLTLSAATSASDTMYCVFIGKAVQTVTPATGSVTGAMLSKPFNYDSGTFYLDDTNNRVGISNSSPVSPLTVGGIQETGTDRASIAVKTISNSLAIGESAIQIEEQSGTEGYFMGVDSTGGLFFSNSGSATKTLYLGDDDNVGIGTTSPTDLLDVRGSIKARDASDSVGRFHTRNAFTVTNGTAVQLTSVCGSAIVCVSCNTTGSGGLFWGTFSTTVSKLAGNGVTSDSGTDDIAVYKNSSSNLMYFKNRSGFSRDYVITVYAARHA